MFARTLVREVPQCRQYEAPCEISPPHSLQYAIYKLPMSEGKLSNGAMHRSLGVEVQTIPLCHDIERDYVAVSVA